MSHPTKPHSAGPLLTPDELQRYEAPLIALANLSGGDLRKLFYAFFSFLHRRTDFYCILPDEGANVGVGKNMGFREGQAEQILLASFRQFPLRSTTAGNAGEKGTSRVSGSDRGSSPVKATRPRKCDADDDDPSEAASPESNQVAVIEGGGATKNAGVERGSPTAIRFAQDGKQIPVGNGGSTPRYVWTQTLDEVVVFLPVPEGTRAKDLDVNIGAASLDVRRKDGAAVFLEGTLFARIRPSESTWTLESGDGARASKPATTLLLTLEKIQKTWWATVISGDPVIDTSLVDSTRRIDSYDEVTQAQIRRILFDQRQERLGLPKSGEWIGETMTAPPLPAGVEYVDGETLERATVSRKGEAKNETP